MTGAFLCRSKNRLQDLAVENGLGATRQQPLGSGPNTAKTRSAAISEFRRSMLARNEAAGLRVLPCRALETIRSLRRGKASLLLNVAFAPKFSLCRAISQLRKNCCALAPSSNPTGLPARARVANFMVNRAKSSARVTRATAPTRMARRDTNAWLAQRYSLPAARLTSASGRRIKIATFLRIWSIPYLFGE